MSEYYITRKGRRKMTKLERWAYYNREARFLGISYIRIDTLDVLEVKKQLKKEGLHVEELEVYLVRDYC